MPYPDTERPLQRDRIDGAAFFLQGDVCVVFGALNVRCFSAIGQVKIFYFIAALILYPIL
jgi:hypothetical protein